MATQYPDIPYVGPPAGYNDERSPKRYIAIHNTSNTATAEAEANYATRRTDDVSSHYYVDNDSLIQSLSTDLGAWHAASNTGNTYAIAYEITGTNDRSRAWWLANVAWSLLARQIARDCKRHGIVPQLLTVAQMRDGKTTGVVTHALMTLAWGGDHTDPGPGFPMDHLLALVRAELEENTVADGYTAGDRKVATLDAHRALATLTGTDVDVTLEGETKPRKETNDIAARLKRIEAQLAELLARPSGVGGGLTLTVSGELHADVAPAAPTS